MRAFELHFAHVAGRHRAHFVDDVHQDLGAHCRQPLTGDRVFREDLLLLRSDLEEAHRVLDARDPAGAPDRYRLEVLRRHHRPDARTARGPVQVVDDRRVQAPRFGGTAHAGDAELRVVVLLMEQLVGFPYRLAPEIVGRDDLGVLVLDVEIHRRGRLALEDDHVPPRVLHFRPDEAPRVRAGHRPGQRTLRHHAVAAAGRGAGAGKGAGGHDQLVLGTERIAAGIYLVDQVAGRETALAEVLGRPFHVEGLGFGRALRQVHAQDFLGPTHRVSSRLFPSDSALRRWRRCRSSPPTRACAPCR